MPSDRLYNDPEEVSFANGDNTWRGDHDTSKVKCFICGNMGNCANGCPTKEDERGDGQETILEGTTTNLMIGEDDDNYDGFEEFTFCQSSKHVNPKWIILHIQSTTDIFWNPALFTNIRDANKSIGINCDAGMRHVSKIRTRNNYGDVWFSKDAIANIMPLSNIKELYPVKYDISDGHQFVVIHPNNQVLFKQSKSGLYYHKTGYRQIVLVNTIQENQEGYTQREFNKVK
jgi:hypothetical protein